MLVQIVVQRVLERPHRAMRVCVLKHRPCGVVRRHVRCGLQRAVEHILSGRGRCLILEHRRGSLGEDLRIA